jgi:hypothetical protein
MIGVEVEMSFTAAHASKRVRRSCECCRERKARFKYRGQVKADRDHTLCFECYRAERERRRALLLTGIDPPSNGLVHGGGAEPRATLGSRQIDHRRRMFEHLSATRP